MSAVWRSASSRCRLRPANASAINIGSRARTSSGARRARSASPLRASRVRALPVSGPIRHQRRADRPHAGRRGLRDPAAGVAALVVPGGPLSLRRSCSSFAAHRYRVARLLALERVRMRIAADLHDDIGGSLSRISIQSEVACREAAALGISQRAGSTDIADSARGLVDALGDVVWSVDPRRDDLASVCRRLREYADDLFSGSGVRWTYTAPPQSRARQARSAGAAPSLPAAQGSVTNIARHASARSRVADDRAGERMSSTRRCATTDAGSTQCASPRRPDRHGMLSMRARAEQLGARLTIESSPDGGTTSRCACRRSGAAAHVHALAETAEVRHDGRRSRGSCGRRTPLCRSRRRRRPRHARRPGGADRRHARVPLRRHLRLGRRGAEAAGRPPRPTSCCSTSISRA